LGSDAGRDVKQMQARLGYMSQHFTLYPDLTAAENVGFYGRVYGLSRRELASSRQEVMGMAGLAGRGKELAATLSGGWRQRLALGCAILHRPELLFLDEPTAGVDPVSRRDFWELIYTLAQQGTTVFVTTHYMDEAEHCQRVGFIHRGRLLALGAPAELKASRMAGQVMEVSCSDAAAAVRILQRARQESALAIYEVALYGAQLHVVVPDAAQVQSAIRMRLESEGVRIQHMERIAPSLEDVFISSVRQAEEQPA